MHTFKFLALPVVGLSLWFGAATYSFTRLVDLSKTNAQQQQLAAQQRAANASSTVTASR